MAKDLKKTNKRGANYKQKSRKKIAKKANNARTEKKM